MRNLFTHFLVLGTFAGISMPALSLTPQEAMQEAHDKTKTAIGEKTTRFVRDFPPIYFNGKLCNSEVQFSEEEQFPTVRVSCDNVNSKGTDCVFTWYSPSKGDESKLEALFFGESEHRVDGDWKTTVQKSYREEKSPVVKYNVLAATIQERVNKECGIDHEKLFKITRNREKQIVPPFPTFDSCEITENESPSIQYTEVVCSRNSPNTSCYFSNQHIKETGSHLEVGSVNYFSNKVQNGITCTDLKCNLNHEARLKINDKEAFFASTETKAKDWFAKNCKQ